MHFLLIFFIFGWRSLWGRTYHLWQFGSYRIFSTLICRKLFFCPKFYSAVFIPSFMKMVRWAWSVLVRVEASYHWVGAWCFRVWHCWWEEAGLGRWYFEIVETHFDYLLKLYYYLIVAWSSPVLASLSKEQIYLFSYLGRRKDINIRSLKWFFCRIGLLLFSVWVGHGQIQTLTSETAAQSHQVIGQTGDSDIPGTFEEVDLAHRGAEIAGRWFKAHFAHINLKAA